MSHACTVGSHVDLHEHAWRSIVFKHYLMDNSRTRLPELNSVFSRSALKEIENLLVRDY